MRKKLLSVLLVLCMALSLLPTAALADEPEVPTTPEEVTTEPLENTQEPEQAAELPEEAVTYDAPQSTDQAEVNGTAYPTLAAALDAAGDGDTVTLLSDVTATTYDGSVTISKKVTLDLNQYSLIAKESGWFSLKAEITLKNGTVSYEKSDGLSINAPVVMVDCTLKSSTGSAVKLSSGSTLTATNCTFEMTGKGSAAIKGTADQVLLNGCTVNGGTSTYAIDLTSNDVLLTDCTVSGGSSESIYAVVSNAGGTFTVDGGSITATADKPAASITWSSQGTLVIKGESEVSGTVKMYGTADNAGGHIRIEGGCYSAESTIASNKPANVEIVGGYYTENSNVGDFVKAPYMVVANTDDANKEAYPKAIAAPETGSVAYVADVNGGTSYKTIDEAIAGANGKPILLLADVELSSLPADTSINAQNKSVSYGGSLAKLVSTGAELINVGTLTVTDGAVGSFTMAAKEITAGFVPEALRATVLKYIPDDYSIGDQNGLNGKVAATSSFGATIGRTGYEALVNALSVACQNDTSSSQINDVVVMQQDSSSHTEALAYATYTLDLNGHTLGGSSNEYGFGIVPVSVLSPSHANITLTDSAKSGEIVGSNFGVVLNGEVPGVKLVLDGVKVTSTTGEGVYFPGKEHSALTIKSGTEITGSTGLGIKGGNVIIENGAKISGTRATSEIPEASTPSGISDLTGDAVYVECGYNFPLSLTIQGGCFSSVSGEMVRMLFSDTTEVEETISISGGYFSAKLDSKYLAAGYYVQPSDKDGYSYMVSDSAVAQIGTDKYGTLAEAVAAAGEGQTIRMLKNTTLDSVLSFSGDKAVTLDLNGKTITSDYAINIDTGAKVTIQGSTGTIALNNGARLIITGNTAYENSGVHIPEKAVLSTLNLKSGTITSSKGATVYVRGSGATLNMTGGTVRNTYKNGTTDGNFAISGDGTRDSKTDNGGITINISGGTVESVQDCALYLPGANTTSISGNAVIKGWCGIEIDSGKLTVSGGTIQSTYSGDGTRKYKPSGSGNYNFGTALAIVSKGNQSATSYYGHMDITITGGTFISPTYYAIDEYNLAHVQNEANPSAAYIEENGFSITGGYFSGKVGAILSDNMKSFITGGRFTSDPTAYLATDYLAVTEDYTTGGVTYKYAVQEKKTEVEVVVSPPNVAPLPENAKDEVKEAAAALETAPAPEGLETVANKVAQNTTLTSDSPSVKKALEEAEIDIADESVTIVVEPYLNIEVKDCVKDEGSDALVTLELNITPMYNTVATTANVSEGDELVKEIPEGNDNPDLKVNAAVVGSPKPMTVTTPVTITIPLPDGFSVENLKVQHTKSNGSVYYYDATIEGDSSKTATFTVTHGFSKFVLKADARTATVTFKNGNDIVAESQSFNALNVGDKLPTASKSGYSFSGWTFEGIDGTYTTLTDKLLDALNGKDVTATAKFSANSSGGGGGGGSVVTPPTGWKNPFTDVNENDWCYDAVKYAVENGLFNGTTDTTFSPNATMTRGMLVTVLYRLEGSPAVTAAPSFSDVAADSYCAKAVVWANANGIVKGFSEDVFAPGSNITREQMAAILYRYAQYKGMEAVTLEENLTSFPDADEISEYAVSAMNWAVGKQLITGKTDGTLSPKGNATRAQVATILMRYCETVAK
ncbi:S-layer homology domain-containing protein [Oscillibacter sp. MSJ-2]|uniref:S-layer homology domain-containing protein n=1 Tax=Dysosmobacter acutus TaxID=2841504 RepID=A0ABS6FAT7_9FIRM|nr:S-layer homology domain-containing protein [Dysosmobacter acutus]MBU5627391.1 S-layer homology domain-containing protein [Dysosmobacter acutus]